MTGHGATCHIEIIGLSLLTQGPKLFNFSGSRSFISATGDIVGSGFTWALSGDRNIVHVICDAAGSNTGTGNNITEVNY